MQRAAQVAMQDSFLHSLGRVRAKRHSNCLQLVLSDGLSSWPLLK